MAFILAQLLLVLWEPKCPDTVYLVTLLTPPAEWNQPERVEKSIPFNHSHDDFVHNFINNKNFYYMYTALKIHITAEMNDKLAIIGGFKTEHRGLIDVKVSICISI